MFERNELEAFVVLAEDLHFRRAAERLHISTPQLSQLIRRLERRIGSPLFRRTTRKVDLTPVGRQLFEDIEPAWLQLATAVENALHASRSLAGRLDIAFVTAGGSQLLTEVTRRFRLRHPECHVRLREASLHQVWPWLRDGAVDMALLAVSAAEPDFVIGSVMATIPLSLAVPSVHPLAREESVTLEDLAQSPMIQLPDTLPAGMRELLTPRATPNGNMIPPGPIAHTVLEALAMAGAGQGVSAVDATASRYYPRPDLVYLPIQGAAPVSWCLVWHINHDTPLVRSYNRSAGRNAVAVSRKPADRAERVAERAME